MQDQSGRPGRGACQAGASGPPPPGAGATAHRERWARLRRSLWQPPRPHGEQPRERAVGPLELFYDLAVVVLVAQAAPRQVPGQVAGGLRDQHDHGEIVEELERADHALARLLTVKAGRLP